MPVSRRAVLEGASAVAPLGFLAKRQGEEGESATRRVLVPRVEEFEDNYVGQWVALNETADVEVELDAVDECEYANWSADETQAYEGQLLDRRSEEPIAIDILAFTDGAQPEFEVHSVFIVNRVHDCTPDYVGVDLEWVPRRSVRGESPGPTVPEFEGAPGA